MWSAWPQLDPFGSGCSISVCFQRHLSALNVLILNVQVTYWSERSFIQSVCLAFTSVTAEALSLWCLLWYMMPTAEDETWKIWNSSYSTDSDFFDLTLHDEFTQWYHAVRDLPSPCGAIFVWDWSVSISMCGKDSVATTLGVNLLMSCFESTFNRVLKTEHHVEVARFAQKYWFNGKTNFEALGLSDSVPGCCGFTITIGCLPPL